MNKTLFGMAMTLLTITLACPASANTDGSFSAVPNVYMYNNQYPGLWSVTSISTSNYEYIYSGQPLIPNLIPMPGVTNISVSFFPRPF
jgi:hypothetical protein